MATFSHWQHFPLPLRRAYTFAQASSFAKATEDKPEDKTEDKLIRAKGFMGCSLWSDVLEYIRGGWLVEARLELWLDEDVVDIDSHIPRIEP